MIELAIAIGLVIALLVGIFGSAITAAMIELDRDRNGGQQ